MAITAKADYLMLVEQDTGLFELSLDSWKLQTKCIIINKTKEISYTYLIKKGYCFSNQENPQQLKKYKITVSNAKIIQVNFPSNCFVKESFFKNETLIFYRKV
jgi:hypothetical protein